MRRGTRKKLTPPGRWTAFVKYMMQNNPNKSLKELLKTYKKKDYQAFCKKCVQF